MAEQQQDRPNEEKSAAQIEREIDQTRAEIDETLDSIFTRLTPGDLFEQTVDYLRTSHGFARFGATLRDNPVPAVLAAFSIGWLLIAAMRSRPERFEPARTPLPAPDYGSVDRTAVTVATEPAGDDSVAGSDRVVGSDAQEERSFTSTTSRASDVASEPTGPAATERSG